MWWHESVHGMEIVQKHPGRFEEALHPAVLKSRTSICLHPSLKIEWIFHLQNVLYY